MSAGLDRSAPTRLVIALVLLTSAGCTQRTRFDEGMEPEAISRSCARELSYKAPQEDRPRYSLRMRVRSPLSLVSGRLSVDFTPDLPTRRIVFRLWANGPRHVAQGARLQVQRVRLNGVPAGTRRPDPTTLVLPLVERLEAGQGVEVAMSWRLRVPGPVLDRISINGSEVRLGSFFPLLAWHEGSGWQTDPPTTALGETSSSPTADFDVRIATPAGTAVLATGREVAPGRWRAEAVRDFAVAVGRFRIARSTVAAPDPVRVRVGVSRGLSASPQEFLSAAVRALRDLSRRYGRYPWPTFDLAIMPDLQGAGIEYPAMVFQGEASLERATTHEVGHSWFYGLVGNNQARDPWLDETLASWAQARGDGILGWFRTVPIPPEARGRLGSPMTYWDLHDVSYFEGVYAQGVQALASLGNPALVDCALRLYVARNAYRIARPGDLITALEVMFPDTARRLARLGVET